MVIPKRLKKRWLLEGYKRALSEDEKNIQFRHSIINRVGEMGNKFEKKDKTISELIDKIRTSLSNLSLLYANKERHDELKIEYCIDISMTLRSIVDYIENNQNYYIIIDKEVVENIKTSLEESINLIYKYADEDDQHKLFNTIENAVLNVTPNPDEVIVNPHYR